MPRLTFWYEFASTYSYLSAVRIEAAAGSVEVAWQPFLLGPIFHAQGWSTSPFDIYPAKGRYMVRGVGRMAAARGLEFHMPEPFPANSLKAARLAVVGIDEGWVVPVSKAVFEAEFASRLDIASEGVLHEILGRLGLDAPRALTRSAEPGDQGAAACGNGRRGSSRHIRRSHFRDAGWRTVRGDDRLENALADAQN